MHPIRLSDTRFKEILKIIELGAPQIDMIRTSVADARHKFLKLEDLASYISSHFRQTAAVAVVTMCVQLRRTAYSLDIKVKEVLESITNDLRERDLDREHFVTWENINKSLLAIASDPKIELVVKTSDLYYRHHYHLHEAKIITDTRPILSQDRTSIEAMIVKNTLFIEYSDGEENEKYLEIAMQLEGIRHLRDELDRALHKSEAVKKINEQRLDIPVITYDTEW